MISPIAASPDGVEAARFDETTGPHGAIELALPFAGSSQTGGWRLRAHIDPDGPAIADLPIEVQDFVPPRIELTLTAEPSALGVGEDERERTAVIDAEVDYLYGAQAADLDAALRTNIVRRPDPIRDWPDYRFGLVQEEWALIENQAELAATDSLGRTSLPFEASPLPTPPCRWRQKSG